MPSQYTLINRNTRVQKVKNAYQSTNPCSLNETTYTRFLSLIIPTICSSVLLAADRHHLSFSGNTYIWIVQNRASVSIIVQITAAALGLVQVSAICRLFNYASRIRLSKRPVPLGLLTFWNGMSLPSIHWNLHLGHLITLLIFNLLCTLPSALWAGSLTPVSTVSSHFTTIQIPQFFNMTSIREWPSQVSESGPSLRNEKGFFTYSPGILYQGLLSQSLSTATTLDGSLRQHPKYDNSKFTYLGRSYGAGASVGLSDDAILKNAFATGYTFQEVGYIAETECVYNSSTNFVLEPDGEDLYTAIGYLPDSASGEFSVYLGHDPSAIVAIGVAAANTGPNPRYFGIAAGTSYSNLNTAQCKTSFIPSVFNVSVHITSKNITVTKINATANDIDPSRNLTHVLERQFELFSNQLTTFYQVSINRHCKNIGSRI